MQRFILTALALVACAFTAQSATTVSTNEPARVAAVSPAEGKPSMLTENTNGGYLGTAPYYLVKRGVLYTWDGFQWWYLQQPSIPAGQIRGLPVGQAENWRVVGGSHIRKHQRTPLSFRQQSVRPVMVQY